MTGTATLDIHVQDQNDNSPTLNATSIGICASDTTTEAEISAYDLDGEPFGGPFTFKLLDDHKGWSLDPEYGKEAKQTFNCIPRYTLCMQSSYCILTLK